MAPYDLLQRLREYWPYGKMSEPPPPFSTLYVVLVSVVLTILYIAPFYLSANTRPSPYLTRDAPRVIRARVRAVLISTSSATLVTIYILSTQANVPIRDALHLLGIWPISMLDILGSMILIALLYAGPLYEHLIVEDRWRDWVTFPRDAWKEFRSPEGFRNYIAGPFTEELLFRSVLIPLNILTPQVLEAATGLPGTHARVVLYTTPLYFGVAHVHHLYEFRLQFPRVPFKIALVRSLFQLCFTTIFGWYASFIFLRTGSLWSCFLTHAFCNWMGLPRVYGKVKRPTFTRHGPLFKPKAPVAMGPPKGEPGMSGSDVPPRKLFPSLNSNAPPRKDILKDAYGILGIEEGDTELVKLADAAGIPRPRRGSYERRRPPYVPPETDIRWTIGYYVVLVTGMVGFWMGLWPLTESKAQLAAI